MAPPPRSLPSFPVRDNLSSSVTLRTRWYTQGIRGAGSASHHGHFHTTWAQGTRPKPSSLSFPPRLADQVASHRTGPKWVVFLSPTLGVGGPAVTRGNPGLGDEECQLPKCSPALPRPPKGQSSRLPTFPRLAVRTDGKAHPGVCPRSVPVGGLSHFLSKPPLVTSEHRLRRSWRLSACEKPGIMRRRRGLCLSRL